MKQLKVHFTDFWNGGGEDRIRENPIYKFLSNHYELVLDAKAPDFLFYSCFGDDYRSYDCIRIFNTGENRRPDFDNADYAFTFDPLDHPRHFRLPLYRFYAEYPEVFKPREPDRVLGEERKFCAFVYSNEAARERVQFFDQLCEYKQVDSGGKVRNNIGHNVEDKLAFLRDHRFSIAFENTSHEGYTTEKLLHALVSDTIPIYWGNPRAGEDFNSEAFINCHDYDSFSAVIDHVKEVDADVALQRRDLSASFLRDGEIPACQEDRIIERFDSIFEGAHHQLPRTRKRIQKTLRQLRHWLCH